MKRPLPFAAVFVLALAIVTSLPLYLEQTMTHVMFAHGGGGTIEWGWKLCTLRTFFSDYRYFRHNPHPELWITLNVTLALVYALGIALMVNRFFGRKRPAIDRNAL
jgi:hypothetical protein